MAGEIHIAGDVLTRCPIGMAARDPDAVLLAKLVVPLSSCGMLGCYKDAEIPQRFRIVKRHALEWAEVVRPPAEEG